MSKKASRPENFAEAKDRLTPLERFNISFSKKTFERPWLNRLMTECQRYIGAGWVHYCTRNLVEVHGLERLPTTMEEHSVIFVSNHRSFFDMYVANTVLFRQGYGKRILYPVRSKFFYDHPLGFWVNGLMSFWSMYPPIFRDRKRLSLNHAAFAELAQAVKNGRSVGIHPEGTRKLDDDPYTFLPAQSGVGRLIHLAEANVIPIFVNGLGNDILKQIKGNFNGQGDKIIVVFGEPVDFGDLMKQPGTGKLYRQIAERTLEEIGKLGQEEQQLRG